MSVVHACRSVLLWLLTDVARVRVAGPTTGGTIGAGATAFTPNRLASSCDSPAASMDVPPSLDAPWVPDTHARTGANSARADDRAGAVQPSHGQTACADTDAMAAQRVFEAPGLASRRVPPHLLQARLQSQLASLTHPDLCLEDVWRRRTLGALAQESPFKHIHYTVRAVDSQRHLQQHILTRCIRGWAVLCCCRCFPACTHQTRTLKKRGSALVCARRLRKTRSSSRGCWLVDCCLS